MTVASRRIYWEACVFIDLLEKTPDRIGHLLPIIDAAEQDQIVIVTSALTLAEVSRLRHLQLDDESVEKTILQFFETPFLYLHPVNRFVAERSRPIIRNFGLKPLDAIHVASALMMKVERMHTYDAKILKLDGKIEGLRIEEPCGP